jgi:serine/threonine-protein kinase
MVGTELGACEWFVWDLRRSNLIDRGRLDQIVGEFLGKNPSAEPASLAQYLITQGILTDFQAERLLQGKTQGFVLGPFTLMDALGAGSMGTVYKAQSKTDNNWYAVKVLPRRSMWNVRIARRKVRAFEQCRHPAVLPFVDVGTAGGMHYLAWPLVSGTTLDKIVAEKGRLSPSLAAFYAVQIAEGLDVCHTQGLIHGLLKPSNLMVAPGEQVHILDFGIGCLLAETEGESLVDTMSTANAVASGLDCASPESIMDPTNLTPQGDQYSLGCILYFMLTGQYPFPDGSAAEKMMAHQFKQPTPITELAPDVPPQLAEIVERLMQKAPDARFTNAGEIVEMLRPFAVKPAGSGPIQRPRTLPGGAPKKESSASMKKDTFNPRTGSLSPTPRPTGSVPNLPTAAAPPSSSAQLNRPNTPAPPAAKAPSRPATVAHTVRPATMAAIPGMPISRSPAPSAPTPQPQAIGSLPTRNSIRASVTPPPSVAKASPPLDDDAVDLAGGEEVGSKSLPRGSFPIFAEEPQAPETKRWDEKLGSVGVAVLTALICSAVFFVARYFKLI